MAGNEPKKREEAQKAVPRATAKAKKSASTVTTKIPRNELIALRATKEMMAQARKLIKDHGNVRAPLAAMLKADAYALSGDLDDFQFYALVSMVCVVNLMLCDKDTTGESMRWEDVL